MSFFLLQPIAQNNNIASNAIVPATNVAADGFGLALPAIFALTNIVGGAGKKTAEELLASGDLQNISAQEQSVVASYFTQIIQQFQNDASDNTVDFNVGVAPANIKNIAAENNFMAEAMALVNKDKTLVNIDELPVGETAVAWQFLQPQDFTQITVAAVAFNEVVINPQKIVVNDAQPAINQNVELPMVGASSVVAILQAVQSEIKINGDINLSGENIDEAVLEMEGATLDAPAFDADVLFDGAQGGGGYQGSNSQSNNSQGGSNNNERALLETTGIAEINPEIGVNDAINFSNNADAASIKSSDIKIDTEIALLRFEESKSTAASYASPFEQISVQIKKLQLNKSGEINLQLNPYELGKVEIKIINDADNKISVQIIADLRETYDLLRTDRANLERILQNQGLANEILSNDASGLSFDESTLQFAYREGAKGNENNNNGENNTPNINNIVENDALTNDAMSEAQIINLNVTTGINIKI